TGIRPSDPTITGTATSSDCSNDVSPSDSWNLGARGLSRAHAQKLRAKPSVAIASIAHGRAGLPAPRAAVAPGPVFRRVSVTSRTTSAPRVRFVGGLPTRPRGNRDRSPRRNLTLTSPAAAE